MANKHPILQALINGAKKTSVLNRGHYPKTAATNTRYIDGTPLEEPIAPSTPEEPGEDDSGSDTGSTDSPEDPEIEVPEPSIDEIIDSTEPGGVVDLEDRTIDTEVEVDKAMSFVSGNQGIPQNFAQDL